MKSLSRRTFLAVAGAAAAIGASPSLAFAHSNAGVVEPAVAPPDVSLTLDDGKAASLRKLLRGRVSALQLMFTSCGATCPIQGAVFAAAAQKLGERVPDARFLSLTIDPGRDDAKALHGWMARFGAHSRWQAGRPEPRQLDPLVEFLKARNPGPDSHTAQVYFFNRRGQLALRSVDFPTVSEILRVLEALALRG